MLYLTEPSRPLKGCPNRMDVLEGWWRHHPFLIIRNDPPFPVKILKLLTGHVLLVIHSHDPLDILAPCPAGGKTLFLQGLFDAVQIGEHLRPFLIVEPDDDQEFPGRGHLHFDPVQKVLVTLQQLPDHRVPLLLRSFP